MLNLPFKRVKGEDPVLRRARRDRFVRALAFTGGALIAGVDLEGRPGISWRVQKARSDHAAAKADRLTEPETSTGLRRHPRLAWVPWISGPRRSPVARSTRSWTCPDRSP